MVYVLLYWNYISDYQYNDQIVLTRRYIYIYNNYKKKIENLTRIRPVVVCPEISSPAQSLASVIKVPSNSLPWRADFCSFCFGSFGESSGSLRQQRKANARQRSTISSPARKVKMLDSRKHHHFRSLRQPSTVTGGCTVVPSVVIPADLCCPRVTHSPATITITNGSCGGQ